MLKFVFVFCVFSLAFSFAYAQDLIIRGRVYEFNTHIQLTDIQVINLSTKKLELTDNHGRFNIKAKMGDLIIFKGFVYQPDTLVITDAREKEILLIPRSNMLKDVNVNTTIAPGMGTYYDPEFHGQTVVYQRDKDLNYKGGVIFRLWYWKKDQHKKEKKEQMVKDDQMHDKIAAVFSPANIGRFVPLKDKDLEDFIILYTPEIKVYNRNDFNLTGYLNDCYTKYLKLSPAQKHPAGLTQ